MVTLDALPELPNGKIDYRRLTLPTVAQPASAMTSEPIPLSAVEATVLQAWTAIFGFGAIARDDDFFAIGGDSILSIQVVSRLRSAGLNVNVGDFAENATIANLAAIAESRGHAEAAMSIARTDGTGTRPTPIQQWFLQLSLIHI